MQTSSNTNAPVTITEALPGVVIADAPIVLVTSLFHERADSRPIWCDHCHDVTIQKLTRTTEGREYVCPDCGGKTVYMIVRRAEEWTK